MLIKTLEHNNFQNNFRIPSVARHIFHKYYFIDTMILTCNVSLMVLLHQLTNFSKDYYKFLVQPKEIFPWR